MKSVMNHKFSTVPRVDTPRSVFLRNFGHKTTFDAGWLVPIFVDEVLPGDTISLGVAAFARLATPLKPIMDNLTLETFFFNVPLRMVWNNFKRMIGEQDNPGDSTSFLVPQMSAPSSPVGYIPPANWASPTTAELASALSDYLGIPTKIAGLTHSSLFHRSYNAIINSWFRDQNLQNSLPLDLGDGPDTYTNYKLVKRGKRHDYITSCLPWPQKGTAPTLTFAGFANVVTNTLAPTVNGSTLSNVKLRVTTAAQNPVKTASAPAAEADLTWGNETGMRTDLSTAQGQTINQIREAFQIQRLMERDARGGSRYHEIVSAHFGVTSLDMRATRPEYLGGTSTPVNIHPIPQQSGSGASGQTTPQGNLAGFGTVSEGGQHTFTKSFTEHGIVIGLVNVRADLTYQQGLHKMFSRRTKLDFYWPALAGLGEQAVLNKEVYADNSANDNLVFGYQERFAEYRYKPSIITGRFRSNDAVTLHSWHLSQQFGALPVLNDSFIQENVPLDRCVAVPSEPDFIGDFYFNYRAVRPIPVYGIPGMMDHF